MIKDDISVELNLGDSNSMELETPVLKGKLKALMIDADKQVSISITNREKGIVVYNVPQCQGIKYLSLQNVITSPIGEKANYSMAEFALNEKLNVLVGGPKQTNVKVTFRLEG